MGFQIDHAEMRKSGGLSPEIAGEGEAVLFTGTVGGMQAKVPAAKPIFPDLSEIKCIRPLFFRVGFEPFPVMLHHPTEASRMFTAEEAEKVGFRYVKPTPHEVAKYKLSGDRGIEQRDEGCLWREEPYGPQKFDPSRPESGKCYTPPQVNPAQVQTALLRELTQIIQHNGAQAASAQTGVIQQLVDALRANARVETSGARERLEAEADSIGIKVDGRWSDDKLAQKIDEHRKSAA